MIGKTPDPVDRTIGRNVRVYRVAKGLSQSDLANQLGISFQQLQKYEKGTNRIGSGRLLKIAQILNVDIAAFFEGCGERAELKTVGAFDELAKPDSLRLIQAFAEIDNLQIRRCLVQLVETVAKSK